LHGPWAGRTIRRPSSGARSNPGEIIPRSRARISPVLGLTLLLAAAPAAGQDRAPDPRNYRFASELTDNAGLWVNPGVAGFNEQVRLNGHITFLRPGEDSWETGQYLLGLQFQGFGFGYQHDEFDQEAGYAQGDAYTLSFGFAGKGNGLGVTRTWRTVGPADGSWDIGYAFASPNGVTLGVVWRDIGSTAVRDTILDERVVGALTIRPTNAIFSVSGQVDYKTSVGDFRAFRLGGSLTFLEVVDALILVEWNGNGDFIGFQLGAYLPGPKWFGTAVAGLESNGDARKASLGLSAAGEAGRR
jgi:hypothetical protein